MCESVGLPIDLHWQAISATASRSCVAPALGTRWRHPLSDNLSELSSVFHLLDIPQAGCPFVELRRNESGVSAGGMVIGIIDLRDGCPPGNEPLEVKDEGIPE